MLKQHFDTSARMRAHAILLSGGKFPTWVILDNAHQHTSVLFKDKISAWEKRDLFIHYLPAYSPELNLIEILWRFIKYAWLPFSAYLNFDSSRKNLEIILRNVGIKYHINFA